VVVVEQAHLIIVLAAAHLKTKQVATAALA
jgi:hypothetical protein